MLHVRFFFKVWVLGPKSSKIVGAIAPQIVLKIGMTRKYPLRGYILGVLTHTTALD